MKKIKPNLYLTGMGLALCLGGTCIGIQLSSSIQATPFAFGIVAAIWCAVSAGIIAGTMKRMHTR